MDVDADLEPGCEDEGHDSDSEPAAGPFCCAYDEADQRRVVIAEGIAGRTLWVVDGARPGS